MQTSDIKNKLDSQLHCLITNIKKLIKYKKLIDITADSRQVDENSIFAALKGLHVDARSFVPQVVKKGCTTIFTYLDKDNPFLIGSPIKNNDDDPLNCEQDSEIYSPAHLYADFASHFKRNIEGKVVDIIEIKNIEKYLSFIGLTFYDFLAHIENEDKLGLTVPVIGITGTNGKTSTANFIAQALHKLDPEHPIYNIGTIGLGKWPNLRKAINTTPDAISVMREIADANYDNASAMVMEVSSHALDLYRIANVRFKQAIFTNLTQDHLDFHGSIEKYFEAKAKLFTTHNVQDYIITCDCANDHWSSKLVEYCTNAIVMRDSTRHHSRGLSPEIQATMAIAGAVVNNDQASTSSENSRANPLGSHVTGSYINDIVSSVLNITQPSRVLVIQVGEEHNQNINFKADIIVSLDNIETLPSGLIVNFSINDKLTNYKQNFSLKVSLIGKFNAYNLLVAFSSLYLLGHKPEAIIKTLEQSEPVKGRMQLVSTYNSKHQGKTILVDFAHTPDALEKLLLASKEHFKQSKNSKTWIVFGCGGDRDVQKRPLMGKIAADLADHVIVTDDNPRSEEPQDIAKNIISGIEPTSIGKVQYISPREDAIKFAVQNAKDEDLIIVAGKGHETEQIIKGEVKHFSDIEQLEQIIKL